jgi:hypothetical protein
VASKILTRDQAESRKDKAVRFAESVLDDPDLADDIASEDLDDWVERKGITLIDNPRERSLKSLKMANGNGGSDMTKTELQGCVDGALDILQGAYTPEASREELAAAVGDAIDALSGDSGGDDADEDDDTDLDDDQS